MLINLALRRKENGKFKANLGYIARLFQKKKKGKEIRKERRGCWEERKKIQLVIIIMATF